MSLADNQLQIEVGINRPSKTTRDGPDGTRLPGLDAHYQYVAALFQALSVPARVKLILQLHQGEQRASDLAQAARTSPSNVSQHLALLLSLGFVHRRRCGQQVFYRLSRRYWGELLAELCATAPDVRAVPNEALLSFSREAKPQDQSA